jgi:cytochrome c oxidase subunit 2
MEDTTESDMVLKVTGYQWGWQYDYLEEDVSFFSKLATPQSQITGNETKGENYLLEVDNHVVIPAGKKVRLLLTAKDVIHAWWVPQLGGKKDAIPGYINEMWIRADETGTYRGQCGRTMWERPRLYGPSSLMLSKRPSTWPGSKHKRTKAKADQFLYLVI